MFDDWLDLMLYSLQGRDDPYLEIVDRYDNDREQGEREIDYFCEAFGQLRYGMSQTDADLLGVIYEAYGQSNDHFGQYFTPHNVSDAMAAMQLDGVDPDRYRSGDPLTVADPACGSGRLLISAARTIPDDVEHAVFYGQDKDRTCTKMTALNLCLFNLDGYAVLGDSLRMEARRMWATRGSPFGGSITELDPDEVGNPFTDGMPEQGSEEDEDEEDERGDTPAVDTAAVELETAAAVDLRQTTFTEYSQ